MNAKDAAFAELAFDLYPAAMGAHQKGGDVEPQPQAFMPAIGLGSVETLEQVGQLLAGNANAMVGDGDANTPSGAA
jgi:hypothetical protein